MAQPTVDDLQSMFPQMPLTAIQDIVEQSGSADRAMEVLLASADTQRASHSPATVPLVSMQLVNMPAASPPGIKPRPMPGIGTAHVGGQLAHNNSWLPPYLMHDIKVARHKSPRKKERTTGGAVGVLGILSSMHDIKTGRASPSRVKRSVSPRCNGHMLVVQPPHPPQPQQQPSAALLPWQQAISSQAAMPNACVSCSTRSPSPACQQAVSKVASVVVGQGVIGQPQFATPITSPAMLERSRRMTSPDVLVAPPAGQTSGQHLLALVNGNNENSTVTTPSGSNAAESLHSSPSQQPALFPYLQQQPPQPQPQPLFPYLQNQQASNNSSPSTSPQGGQLPITPRKNHRAASPAPPPAVPVAAPAATAPDVAQKVQFLRGMFADLDLTDANLEHLLGSCGGDVEVAVNKLLEVQTSMDAGGLSEETSSQASNDDATPEARLERALACLRALYPNMPSQEVEGVLAAMDNDVDAAVEVLQDIQRSESQRAQQLATDEALARRLQQQQQAQPLQPRAQTPHQPPPPELPVPRPSSSPYSTGPPTPAAGSPLPSARSPASAAPSPTPPAAPFPSPGSGAAQRRQQPGSYTWEQQEEARMVACRVTMLRRTFAVQLERDMLEAMLADAGQDVSLVRDRLLAAGMPLREGREAPAGAERRAAAAPADGAAAVSEAELRAMRTSAPSAARAAIHEQTQAMYDQERAQARAWMAMKKEFMAESSHYFALGDRDKAEALRAEGLRYGQMAYEANRRAKDRIYTRRNNTLSNSWDIDLHGLHIEEALDKFDTHVTVFNNLPSYKRIKVITGRGAHSRGQEPKLYLAVRDHLLENEYDFEAHLGHFVVHLPPPGEPSAASGARGRGATGSVPPTPGRTSPVGQASSARRCRTQDDEELHSVRPAQQLVVPLSAYLRNGR